MNTKALKGRGFFRTAFYFPSITSSVAISITFLFLFQNTGVVNTILGWFGIQGPTWFTDADGLRLTTAHDIHKVIFIDFRFFKTFTCFI